MWIFVGALWVAGWGVYIWDSRIAGVEDKTGREFVTYHTDLGNGWTELKDFSTSTYLSLAGIGIGIPVAILGLGASVGWIAAGFRPLPRQPPHTKERKLVVSEDAKWHWGEGNKHVAEGGKAALITNGAAAISVLTFLGHITRHPTSLLVAMVLFAFGALLSVGIFACAYYTQLQYGNSDLDNARKWHKATYVVVFSSILFFVAGTAVAAWGFSKLT